uniref:DedA family protein n=1 Tax=uncultured Sphingomonas sp. TaxID=158754 RepID=UPI0035CA1F74
MSIEAIIAKYGLVALFLGAGIEGETVVVAGGLLSHKGLLPLPGAMAAAAAGSFVADQIFFSAGRYFRGRAWVKRQQQRPVFARALGMLERHPIGFIFAFRFIYGFRTISPIAIGTTRVETRMFVLINAIAAIVWGIVFTGIGYLFGHSFERLLDRFVPHGHALWILVGVVVAIAAIIGGVHWWRSRRAAGQ